MRLKNKAERPVFRVILPFFCLDAFVLCPITMKVVSDNKHSSNRNMYYFF